MAVNSLTLGWLYGCLYVILIIVFSSGHCNIPNLTQRGQFRGREVQLLNYITNTVFSAFPHQYKSMPNKDLFCIENLFFIIPNENYLSKTGACSIILGYSPTWGAFCQTLHDLRKPSSASANPSPPLQIVLYLCKPWPLQTLLCVTSGSTCRDLLWVTSGNRFGCSCILCRFWCGNYCVGYLFRGEILCQFFVSRGCFISIYSLFRFFVLCIIFYFCFNFFIFYFLFLFLFYYIILYFTYYCFLYYCLFYILFFYIFLFCFIIYIFLFCFILYI